MPMIWVNSGHAFQQNRGMFTEISRAYIGHFYPNLAKVGKEVLKEWAWLEYAVARRFVQCGGVKNPATPALAWGRSSNMGLYTAKCLVFQPNPPASVWHTYDMIARRGERPYGLIIGIGHNCPKTPRISYCQGKMAR
jgi:hypothetical protein